MSLRCRSAPCLRSPAVPLQLRIRSGRWAHFQPCRAANKVMVGSRSYPTTATQTICVRSTPGRLMVGRNCRHSVFLMPCREAICGADLPDTIASRLLSVSGKVCGVLSRPFINGGVGHALPSGFLVHSHRVVWAKVARLSDVVFGTLHMKPKYPLQDLCIHVPVARYECGLHAGRTSATLP